MTKLEIFVSDGVEDKSCIVFRARENMCEGEANLDVDMVDKDGNKATVSNISQFQIKQLAAYLNASLMYERY